MENILWRKKSLPESIKCPVTHSPCSVLSTEAPMLSKSLATLWVTTFTGFELEIYSTPQEVSRYLEMRVMLSSIVLISKNQQ